MFENNIVAIHQPNYLPWIGYFNKIKQSDIFVFLDDVQFERGKTFTSRSRILNKSTEQWLTVPVIGKSQLLNIKDIRCDTQQNWQRKHISTIKNIYSKSPFFDEVFDVINSVLSCKYEYLFQYNIELISKISYYLNLDVEFRCSSQMNIDSSLTGLDKIIDILKINTASIYLSGSGEGSRRYIDESVFEREGIILNWQKYTPVQYEQASNDSFVPNLSIIDLLFNKGMKSIDYI